jgi:aminoglycoside phosphotransferase (APT) family kinase protein
MAKMHDDELELDESLVRGLIEEQFPEWAAQSLRRVEPSGTDNAIFRLGNDLAVRLPRRAGSLDEEDKEHTWLPRLAPRLPVEVPLPVARGRPGPGYPWHWSVCTWLEGETPIGVPLAAGELVAFVEALQRIDSRGAPDPGAGRGEPLAMRDRQVRNALERIEVPGAGELWEEAAAAPQWQGERVWLHADLDARNVLVRDGRLSGAIDWGCVGAGDPAVDVMAAWKLLNADGRERFREALAVDEDTWLRAQGWAVSQALLALHYYTLETNPVLVREAQHWLAEVLAS